MLTIKHKKIHVPKREIWVESTEEFLEFPETDIEIENSLVAISQWESKYHKPFLSTEKTPEETLDYIRMMIVGKEPDNVETFIKTLPQSVLNEIDAYIKDPMTATTFGKEDNEKSSDKEIITAEIIYYWMTAQYIPFECEMWHINKLIALIKVCGIKNKPDDDKKKKMTSSDLAARRARMQAARAKYKH